MNQLKLLLVILAATGLVFLSYQPAFAQENPEDLLSCNGPEGSVEDPFSEACVIRDCDCNRTANNGKIGELICMEKRTVKNNDGQIQYACKFPNSPTGVSCDTIGFRCPGASSDSLPFDANTTPAETQDPNQFAVICEEKLLAWNAERQCDSQYNRMVTLDRWQAAVVDPDTGRCKEFFLPNTLLEDQKCEASIGVCERGPVDLNCATKICLSDGAEACQETWRDDNCNETTRVGRLTGNKCKTDTTIVDITSSIQTATQAQLPSQAQEFGINITMGFRDRATVRGSFKLKINAGPLDSQPKTIWDMAAVWLDGSRFTLNPNNYHQSNFDLNNISSDMLVFLLTTRVSEEAYEAHPQVQIEFSDGSTREGTLDIKIEPGWVGTSGPKTIEQLLNTLEKITVTNPYTGDYFILDRKRIMDFAKAYIPGQITNEEVVYSIILAVKFRDGSELNSSAFLVLEKSPGQEKVQTVWDISGIEINGYNFTLNPDNIQPNNFTFYENPEVIAEALRLEVPADQTKEYRFDALVKYQDGTTRDAWFKVILYPEERKDSKIKTLAEALSNIQTVNLYDPYIGTAYVFDPESIKNGWGDVMDVIIPEGQTQVTLPISLNFVSGATRSDSITLIYDPTETIKQQNDFLTPPIISDTPTSASVTVPESQTDDFLAPTIITDPPPSTVTPNPPQVTEATLIPAERTCLVRGNTNTDCTNPFGFGKCLEPDALKGELFIGFKLNLPTGVQNRYFQFDPVENADNFRAPNLLELGKIFLGLQAWDQNVSLITQNNVLLPQDVSVIPITIEDRRDSSNIKTYVINARVVPYRPNPGICP